MVLYHVFGVLGLIEYGWKVVLVGHFEDISTVDIEVVLADLFANESPSYYRRYVPEEIGLLFLFEGDGELLVESLLAIPPGDHGPLLALEVVL